jgi:hypothetical protein
MNVDMESTDSKMQKSLRQLKEFYDSANDRRYNWTLGILIVLLFIALLILIAI